MAGLVMLNNIDYGIPAFGATTAALLWTTVDWRSTALLRRGGEVALGLAGAWGLVSILTLARAGSLPQLGRLVAFARLYSLGGFADMPMPGVFGLHLIIYVTYAAAIGTATVRAIRHEPNRVLTGMLAWSGVFGLGAASYYVGRSHPNSLQASFAIWALTLALLAYIVIGQIATTRRRPQIAAVAVLFALGVTICSLAQIPMPWTQLQRIEGTSENFAQGAIVSLPLVPIMESQTRQFVSSLAYGNRFAVKPGVPVALFMTTGHRVADAYGLRDIVPFTGPESIETTQQLDQVIAALRKAGGNTMLLPTGEGVSIGMFQLLTRRGFKVLTPDGLRPGGGNSLSHVALIPWYGGYLMKWVDTRHLHPAALR